MVEEKLFPQSFYKAGLVKTITQRPLHLKDVRYCFQFKGNK